MTATLRSQKPRAAINQQKGSKLVRIALTRTDFAAINHIATKHGHRYKATTVRMCLEQQRLRDLAYGVGSACGKAIEEQFAERLIAKPHLYQIKDTVPPIRAALGRRITNDDELVQWSVWLYPDHLKFVDHIVSGWELELQTDAFRLSIRVQATLDGFTPKDGWT